MAELESTAQDPRRDFIRETPRNPVLGYLSDLAGSTYSPERTQQMQGVAQFFGAPAISQTLNRMAYGEPMTTGAGGIGGTSRIRPEVADAAMSVMDLLPTGGFAKGAALAAPMIGGMFVGKKSATWDALAAAKAKIMTDIGTDPRTIWKETGTWKGPDGKWRQEIDDSAAQLENLSALKAKDKSAFEAKRTQLINEVKEQGGKPTDMQKFRMNQINNQAGVSDAYRGTLGDVLKHEQLYSAYPSKADIPFNWMEMPTGTKGEYSPQSGVALNMGTFGKDAKSTTLHELQHAIQQREGFARGGSPRSAADDVGQELLKASERIRKIEADPSLFEGHKAIDEAFDASINGRITNDEFYKIVAQHPIVAEYSKLQSFRRDAPRDGDEAYRRLAGEAEARLTQSRMNMTPAQRLALFPEESYDVPMNELIIRGAGD
jgi:hypothetical protein